MCEWKKITAKGAKCFAYIQSQDGVEKCQFIQHRDLYILDGAHCWANSIGRYWNISMHHATYINTTTWLVERQ